MSSQQNRLQTLTAVFEAFNRHEAERAVALMTEDCIFETIGGTETFGTRIVGRYAVRKAFTEVWRSFPDAQWDVARHTICGDRAFSEWVFRGTDGSGSVFAAEGVDLFTFHGERIATKRAFRKNRVKP